jgi:ABC-type Fe3+ transport system permease subunit
MRGERHALRAGEYLVSRACRKLPARIREERYQEWLAELPVILHDREVGPAPLRVVRMLAFAADTLRGTTLAPDAYHGAHRGADRGGAVKSIRWLAVGLLLLSALLGAPLALLAYEGYIIYQLGKVAAGAGLLIRAIASQSGWGHPLLFAIISYCGYAISAACLGVTVVLLMRAFPQSSARTVTKAGNQARSG